jgi:hypothetical protein
MPTSRPRPTSGPISGPIWGPIPRALAIAVGLVLCGCTGGQVISQRVDVPLDPASAAAPGREMADATPAIVSAHFALSDDPSLQGRDAIVLVLNVDVDASSLRPGLFWVALENGERVRAEEAFLSPASESDENRTITVVGPFGAPEANPPVGVAIYGNLFAEDGRSLASLGADVEPFAAGAAVVAAERLVPHESRCPGAAGMVRAYWSDPLRGVAPDDLPRVRLRLVDGRVVQPAAFDDHRAGDESVEDNVLDLCIEDSARPVHLSVDAGAFHDVAGHPSVAVEIDVHDAAPAV